MLHYTDHARDRMGERNISEEEVEYCLENHQEKYPCRDKDNAFNYVCTTPQKRRIRVVVDEERPNHKIVISVMDQGR